MIIHVLVTKSDDVYNAHALEFDLMTAGNSPGEAIDHLYDQIEIYAETCFELGMATVDEMIRKAPQEYFDLFQDTFLRPDSHVFMGTISIPDPIKGPKEHATTAV